MGKAPKKGEDKKVVDQPKMKSSKLDPIVAEEGEDGEPIEVADTSGARRKVRKEKYRTRLVQLLEEFKNILIVGIDNVGSKQMQEVRQDLRGRAILLMGKNTVIRKVLREQMEKNPKLEELLPHVRQNVGLVFTNDDLVEIRKSILKSKVPAAAKAGTNAPSDVIVPQGPTGLDPGQTAFFQALNIPTKIVKGAIEIVSDVKLVKEGDRVTASTVALLGKLNLRPFHYGFTTKMVYENGTLYEAKVLDLTREALFLKLAQGLGKFTAISLAAGYPTLPCLPVYFRTAFRRILALALATDYPLAEAKMMEERAAEAQSAAKDEPAKKADSDDEEEEEEEDEESDGEIGGGDRKSVV